MPLKRKPDSGPVIRNGNGKLSCSDCCCEIDDWCKSCLDDAIVFYYLADGDYCFMSTRDEFGNNPYAIGHRDAGEGDCRNWLSELAVQDPTRCVNGWVVTECDGDNCEDWRISYRPQARLYYDDGWKFMLTINYYYQPDTGDPEFISSVDIGPVDAVVSSELIDDLCCFTIKPEYVDPITGWNSIVIPATVLEDVYDADYTIAEGALSITAVICDDCDEYPMLSSPEFGNPLGFGIPEFSQP